MRASQQRVDESLSLVNPTYHHTRRTATARLLNPVPYRADYCGRKLRINQNEKLVMLGLTHMCGVDGFSGKVVGFVTMSIKNCIEIYTNFFR